MHQMFYIEKLHCLKIPACGYQRQNKTSSYSFYIMKYNSFYEVKKRNLVWAWTHY